MQTQSSTLRQNEQILAGILIVKDELKALLNICRQSLPQNILHFLDDAIITGGVSASIWHNEQINDIDVYLPDQKRSEEFVDFVSKPENNVLDYIKDLNPKYYSAKVEGKCITSNAVTFNNKLQVVTVMTKEHRSNFDYVHCMPYYDIQSDKYFISENQVNAIKNKKLIRNPKSTQEVAVYRQQKFLNRGWTL